MSFIALFAEYAQAFELSYLDDDWSRVEPFLDPDVVYEICDVWFACRLVGRDAVLRGIQKSLNGFDRKCQRQIVHIAGPAEIGDQVLTYGMGTLARARARRFSRSGCTRQRATRGIGSSSSQTSTTPA